MNKLRNIYHMIPSRVRYAFFSPIVEKYLDIVWRERKICLGSENSDKTFFVVRFRFPGGIFGLMGYFIPQITYAIDKGYIPVIDMQTNKNMYLEESLIGIQNAWEYYYEQPCNYCLNDIVRSKNIYLGCGGRKASKDDHLSELVFNTDELKKWHEIYHRYIRLNTKTSEYIELQYNKLIQPNDTVLGVLCRGTDYVNNKPKNHPVQPTPEEVIDKVKEYQSRYKCTKIFLATEDQRIWDKFYCTFGSMLITNEHRLYEYSGDLYLPELICNVNTDMYRSGLDYITTINLLARCSFLVAGNCGGSQAAMYITKGYRDSYIFNLGLYS